MILGSQFESNERSEREGRVGQGRGEGESGRGAAGGCGGTKNKFHVTIYFPRQLLQILTL